MRHGGKSLGWLVVALACIAGSSVAWADEGATGEEEVESVVVREPKIRSVGVNFVPDAVETRITRDVRSKISARADLLASCYALHAARHSDPDADLTVDWTITASGAPVGFTVFTSIDSVKPCIRRSLADLEFEHVEGSHPRARVQLSFR